MNQLLGIELFKIRKRRMTWILLAVFVGFIILEVMLRYLVVTSVQNGEGFASLKTALQFPEAFTTTFSATQSIGIMLLIILAASLLGNEYGWGTVNQIISRKGERGSYIGAKVVALIITTLFLVLIGLVVGTLLSIFTTSRLAGGLNWDFFTLSFAGHLIEMFGWTAFTIMVYVLLAMLLATLGRSVVAGIGGALGYFFVESILDGILGNASGWVHQIPDYLIGHNIAALLSVGGGGPFTTTSPPSGLHATIVILIYAAVFLGLIFYFFRRQDLTT